MPGWGPIKWIHFLLLVVFVAPFLWIAQITGFWNGVDGWLDRKLAR